MTTKIFQLVQKPTMGEADFNQFMRLTNQLVIAAENVVREGKLVSSGDTNNVQRHGRTTQNCSHGSWCSWPSKQKDLEYSVAYNLDMPESSYAQVGFFEWKTKDENFQQIVYVNYELEELIHLPDVTNFVYDKVIAIEPIRNVLKKLLNLVTLYHFFSIRFKMSWNSEDKSKPLSQA